MPTWSSRISAQECWNTGIFGWEELSRINPKLVMVRISGYGQTGPYRDRPCFGASGEALGGIRYTKGSPDRPPFRTGIPSANSAFHNTRGLVLANICAAFDSGAVRFDASLGGLGGCPFAPGATANVSRKASCMCSIRWACRRALTWQRCLPSRNVFRHCWDTMFQARW